LASARRRMSRLRADMSPSPPYVLAFIATRIRDSAFICPNYGSGLLAGSAPSHGQGPVPAYYRLSNEKDAIRGGCHVSHAENGLIRRCDRRRFPARAIGARAGGGDAPRRGAVQRRSRLQQGAAQVRAAGQTILRQADQLRAPPQQRAAAGERLLRLHESGHLGRLRHRVAGTHVDLLQGRSLHRCAVPVPRPRPLEQGARRRFAQTDRRRDRAEGGCDADRLCRRRRAQHLRQPAGPQPHRDEGVEGPRARGADLEPHPLGRRHVADRDRLQRNLQRHPKRRHRGGRERGRRGRADEVLRGRSQSLDDGARDHDPADLLLGQDLQEAFARAANGHHQGRQGSRHLWPTGRVLGRQRQARRAGEGRQAQAHRFHRPRGDEEAGRPGNGGLCQGNRGGRDLQPDQRHQIARTPPGAAARAAPSSGAQLALMRKLIDGYCRLLTWLMVATVAILVVPVSLQIISRYTQLIPSYIWTEELSRFLFIWMIMLGAMVGIKEGTHFEVDVWPELSRRANAMLRIVSNLFVLIFALVFVYWGIKFVEFGWYQESELAELPMPFIFIAWPLAGVTWVIFLGEIFVDNICILAGKTAP